VPPSGVAIERGYVDTADAIGPARTLVETADECFMRVDLPEPDAPIMATNSPL